MYFANAYKVGIVAGKLYTHLIWDEMYVTLNRY